MNAEVFFWFLVGTAALEALGIYLTAAAMRTVIASRGFRTKVRNVPEPEETTPAAISEGIPLKALSLTGALLAAGSLQATPLAEVHFVDATATDLWVVGLVNVFLLAVFFYMRRMLDQLVNVDKLAAAEAEEKAPSRLMQLLTDAVPIEEEFRVETDHEYDGIRELDNNLPPWWKWGFAASIVFAVIYLTHYHVTKTGDLQVAAYHHEMEVEQAKVLAYLKEQALNVDEHSVTAMTSDADLSKGKATFTEYCAVCHGDNGEGKVGPNLTDEYWLYGNDIKTIFTTVKYGANRGMKSWQDELNPVQMQEVSSYIRTLVGTAPVNPKDPEGKLMPEQTTPEPQEAPAGSDPTEPIAMQQP